LEALGRDCTLKTLEIVMAVVLIPDRSPLPLLPLPPLPPPLLPPSPHAGTFIDSIM